MAGETTNQGYIDGQAYASSPSGNAPDQTHQEYGRGINSYNLEQAGKSALNSAVIDINSSAPTPSATIDASGNILVGKTASDSAVAGTELKPLGNVVSTADGDSCAFFNRLTSDGSLVIFQQDGSTEGSISIAGSTTSYNTTSDYRRKENVVDLTGATDRLKQLPVHKFNFIGEAKTVDGFLAHELSDVVPEAVTGEKDAVDGDGNPVFQQVDQSKVVPLLVATIKELEARIAALEV